MTPSRIGMWLGAAAAGLGALAAVMPVWDDLPRMIAALAAMCAAMSAYLHAQGGTDGGTQAPPPSG